MKYNYFLPLVSLFFVSAEQLKAEIDQKHQIPPCHLRALDHCYYPAFYFTHRPGTTGIAPNPQQFNLMCKGKVDSLKVQTKSSSKNKLIWNRATRKVFKCIDKFMDECGTDTFSGGFKLIQDLILNSFNQICEDGPMKENFLKYSPCLHAKVKSDIEYKRTCVNDLQAGLEYMTNLSTIDEMINTGCCVYNIWEDCITNMTVAKCGGGERAVYDLIDKASGGLVHIVCKREFFDANSDFCKSKIPPPGTQALGRNSNSIFSKYFTFFCPNTGW